MNKEISPQDEQDTQEQSFIEESNEELAVEENIEAEAKTTIEDSIDDEDEEENEETQDSTDSETAPIDRSEGRWYILHTYSGFEQRVEQTIREMMRLGQDEKLVHEVVVPTEKVIELGKGGKKRTTTRKFYPGYVMIRMTMTDFSWHLVQSIPKVTGFIGGKNRPAPMKPSEANEILSLMQERQEQPRPKFNFNKGDTIRVIDGPFSGFDAVVEDVNHDKGKLKVSISIFGRQTTVELDFMQIAQS